MVNIYLARSTASLTNIVARTCTSFDAVLMTRLASAIYIWVFKYVQFWVIGALRYAVRSITDVLAQVNAMVIVLELTKSQLFIRCLYTSRSDVSTKNSSTLNIT